MEHNHEEVTARAYKRFLFLVSPHGYGHAVRVAVVVAVLAKAPRVEIWVRCPARVQWLFPNLDNVHLDPPGSDIDAGVVEADLLTIDWKKSIGLLRTIDTRKEEIIAQEASWAGDKNIELVVADVPFLAGPIARALRCSCIGFGNFLWDWIYQPIFAGRPEEAPAAPVLTRLMTEGYAQFDGMLRLPFSHAMPGMKNCIDVPLVCGRPTLDPLQVRQAIGLPDDHRPCVLISLRDEAFTREALALADHRRDFRFLYETEKPLSAVAGNVCWVRPRTVPFPDLLELCAIVLGKPGYGLVAACAAQQKPLLFLPRTGFEEDKLLLAANGRDVAMGLIPLEEFRAAAWGAVLDATLGRPPVRTGLSSNGAEVCAKILQTGSWSPVGPAATQSS